MRRMTKKDLALALHSAGRSVEEIARALGSQPSYIANALVAAGETADYGDLYVSTVAAGGYGRAFRGVLRFKDVPTAIRSVAEIDALYRQYAAASDHRGMHQAQVVALTGRNRAAGMGKLAEARVFADWLRDHLDVGPDEPRWEQPRLPMEAAGDGGRH